MACFLIQILRLILWKLVHVSQEKEARRNKTLVEAVWMNGRTGMDYYQRGRCRNEKNSYISGNHFGDNIGYTYFAGLFYSLSRDGGSSTSNQRQGQRQIPQGGYAQTVLTREAMSDSLIFVVLPCIIYLKQFKSVRQKPLTMTPFVIILLPTVQ